MSGGIYYGHGYFAEVGDLVRIHHPDGSPTNKFGIVYKVQIERPPWREEGHKFLHVSGIIGMIDSDFVRPVRGKLDRRAPSIQSRTHPRIKRDET